MSKNFLLHRKNKKFSSKYQNKIEIINPLVKEKIYKIDRTFPKDDKFNILIVGGSQGASIFDNSLKKNCKNFKNISN